MPGWIRNGIAGRLIIGIAVNVILKYMVVIFRLL